MNLSYKQKYPVKGDSIVVEVVGFGSQRISVKGPTKKERDEDPRRFALGTFDRDGLTYWTAQQTGYLGYAEREKPWEVFGDPEPSSRSRAAKNRQTMTAEQKAELDAHMLMVVEGWGGNGASTALLALDAFDNYVFEGQGSWALEYGWGRPKRKRQMALSSLQRLEREGLIVRQPWRYKEKGRWINPWVTVANESPTAPTGWEAIGREYTPYTWRHGED